MLLSCRFCASVFLGSSNRWNRDHLKALTNDCTLALLSLAHWPILLWFHHDLCLLHC